MGWLLLYFFKAYFLSSFRLAELVGHEVDMILGGHDHVYEKKMVSNATKIVPENNITLLKLSCR